MKKFDLLIENIKNIKTVGTLTFSSKFLVKKMIAPIDFERANCIVELGAGNGCITKGLLSKMKPDAKLLAFEIHEGFCEIIKSEIDDERLHLINDSAEKIDEYLHKFGVEKADYIVSAVPLIVLPKPIALNIVNAAKQSLSPDGLFIQLSYLPLQYKKFDKQFERVKLNFTPLNLPPAFVYVCEKAA